VTYSTQLSEHQATILTPILERVTSLMEGEGVTFESKPVGELLYALYSWRHINDLKQVYKICKESSTTVRVIRRTSTPSILPEGDEAEQAQRRGEKFVHDELIDVLNEDEARKLIGENLSLEEAEYALDEWKRING